MLVETNLPNHDRHPWPQKAAPYPPLELTIHSSLPEDVPVLERDSSLHVLYLIHRRPVVKRKPQYIGDGKCQVSIKDTKKRGGSLN